jgi:hypothetical protein
MKQKDIKELMEQLSNIPDEKELENLPEEEKKAKLKELESLLSGSTSILNTMYDSFRKQEVKKMKISFPHLSEVVLDFKKDAYSLLKIKYNEKIHEVTNQVYDQIKELINMPNKDKSVTLRAMLKRSLLNTREKFRESILQAKECVGTEEELIEATEEFYTSFFNMVFKLIEDAYTEQQQKIQDEIKKAQRQRVDEFTPKEESKEKEATSQDA